MGASVRAVVYAGKGRALLLQDDACDAVADACSCHCMLRGLCSHTCRAYVQAACVSRLAGHHVLLAGKLCL